MARTTTAGVETEADGCKVVDKRVFGVRIKRRPGKIDQDQAEAWLAQQIDKQRQAKLFGQRPQRTFREAAIRYLGENTEQACIDEGSMAFEAARPLHRQARLTGSARCHAGPVREQADANGIGHDGVPFARGGTAHLEPRGAQVARGGWSAVVKHGAALAEHAQGACAQALSVVMGGANTLVCATAAASGPHGAV